MSVYARLVLTIFESRKLCYLTNLTIVALHFTNHIDSLSRKPTRHPTMIPKGVSIFVKSICIRRRNLLQRLSLTDLFRAQPFWLTLLTIVFALAPRIECRNAGSGRATFDFESKCALHYCGSLIFGSRFVNRPRGAWPRPANTADL